MVLIITTGPGEQGRCPNAFFWKHIQTKRVLKRIHPLYPLLPNVVKSWLSKNSNSIQYFSKSSETVQDETAANGIFKDDPIAILLRKMIPNAARVIVPSYVNLQMSQHYQHNLQYTKMISSKSEMIVCKSFMLDQPCWPDENGKKQQLVNSVTFINDGKITCSPGADLDSAIEWAFVLSIHSKPYTGRYDAEVNITCLMEHNEMKVYGTVELSLLTLDGISGDIQTKILGVGAKNVYEMSNESITIFIPYAFDEGALRATGYWDTYKAFFKIAIQATTQFSEKQHAALRTSMPLDRPLANKDTMLPLCILGVNTRMLLENFGLGSIQNLVSFVQSGKLRYFNMTEDLTDLQELFQIAHTLHVPDLINDLCEMVIGQSNANTLHVLVVLAFTYKVNPMHQSKIRHFLLRTSNSLKTSQDSLNCVRRFPQAFIHFICNVA